MEKIEMDKSPHLKYIKCHNGNVWRVIWKEGYLHFERILETYELDKDENYAEKLVGGLI